LDILHAWVPMGSEEKLGFTEFGGGGGGGGGGLVASLLGVTVFSFSFLLIITTIYKIFRIRRLISKEY
jgi:hypothetical protein